MAFRMQAAVPELADLSDEPAHNFEKYGPESKKPGSYAANCILARRLAERGERFGDVPDLVVEVVNDDPASRTRDYEDKRREYAAAGIAEYWIIDAMADRVLVLTLESGDYVTAADGHLNEAVTPRLFPEFFVTIADLLPPG